MACVNGLKSRNTIALGGRKAIPDSYWNVSPKRLGLKIVQLARNWDPIIVIKICPAVMATC